MRNQLGALVAAERQRQGISPADLGVPLEIIEAFEAGREPITLTHLEPIAKALQLDERALREGTLQSLPQPSVFFRQSRMHQDFVASDLEILDEALVIARWRNDLAAMLDEDQGLFPSGSMAPELVAADSTGAAARQGYQLARDLRRALGNEADALPDLCDLAERTCGAAVLVRALATRSSSAVAIKAGAAAAIILASGTVSEQREPFTRAWIAHELCHLFFDPVVDPARGGIQLAMEIDDDQQAQQPERRARAFAAELLLPLAGLRKLLGPPALVRGDLVARQLVTTAREHFGCTWQIAANHLCNHQFIDMDLRDSLERALPPPMTRAWHTVLPEEDGTSRHVVWLTRRAHDADMITDSGARGLLKLDVLAPLPWEH